MADTGAPIEVDIVTSDQGAEPYYQTGDVRQRPAAFDWMPHVLRYAINNPGDAVGEELLTVTNALKRLTPPDLALSALVQVQANPVRWAVTATDPTTTVGMRNDANQSFTLGGIPAMKAFRAIREGAADATLVVIYFS